MSNFSTWWKGISKSDEVKQFTWVCGSEQVLVDEVVSTLRTRLNPQPFDFEYLNAEVDSASDVWSATLHYPIGVGPRLVVIREAQLLDPARIVNLLKNRRYSPDTYVVFVSSETKIPREEDKDGKTQRPVHLKAFSGKGDVVECGPFTQATAKYAIEWVQDLREMRPGVAAHLLDRANGDLRLTRDLCRKLALFPQEPTLTMVNELLREYPKDSLANALLALDKKTALLALQDVAPTDYSALIGLLDSHVDLAGIVHDMLVSHKTNAEISKAAGSRRFLVPEILPVARHYDSKRRASIRRLLSDSDEALRQGEHIGVIETIITFW